VSITPEEIAGKEFLELGGGYDQGEVRSFLKGLAKEHAALLERLADRQGTQEDGSAGLEVASIFDAARSAAEQLLAKAERVAADRVEAAEKEATLLRDSVATAADNLKREADEYLERTRAAADQDARDRLGDTTRRLDALLLAEARVRELLYSLEVILPEIREDLLDAERDIVENIDRTIALDEEPARSVPAAP
jgi:cell division septum initiation protein DivIVA